MERCCLEHHRSLAPLIGGLLVSLAARQSPPPLEIPLHLTKKDTNSKDVKWEEVPVNSTGMHGYFLLKYINKQDASQCYSR
ncbi:hypothetical protein V6N13_089583 [Hibiscus sabdariffa]